MFAIKRVFAAPPGKTSGFADLFYRVSKHNSSTDLSTVGAARDSTISLPTLQQEAPCI